MNEETKIGLALILPLIILQFLVSLYPMGYSLNLAFHQASFEHGIGSFVGLDNFAAIGADTELPAATLVSVRFVIESVGLIFLISLGLALLLNEQGIPGRSILKVIVILPWSLSEFAVAIAGRFFLDSNYGFLNAILIRLHLVKFGYFFLNAQNGVEWLSLFYAWNFAPIGAFFILSSLHTVPDELYKASKIDGAHMIRRFRLITFPFVKYSVLITLVLSTIQAAGAVVIFFTLTGGGPGNASLPVTLYNFVVFFRQGNYGFGSAISWTTLIIVASATTSYFILLTRKRN